MFEFFSPPLILVYAAAYGATMKLADLLDEHGWRWFRGDALLFGLLWGLFGALLVLSNQEVANVILAMIIAYIIRRRLDYPNHAVAAAIILVTFLWRQTFDLPLFASFLAVFVVFGLTKDYLGDVRKRRDWWYKISEPAWYYLIAPAIYGLVTGSWLPFAALTVYRLAYNAVKYGLGEDQPRGKRA